ncbi:sugar transferase [Listeria sp. PSOL-1]|uniref:sugar transferase n=1 Tax=Listeria sp. PSOL-1 TaxID=1844999 RepID=UPI0013D2FBEA
MEYINFKKGMDFAFASLLIIVCSIPMLIIALAIRVTIKEKALFTQQRVGKGGAIFTIYKFKTMKEEHDNNGNLLSDELRLFKLGKILRKTSLDELPQLFNIIKGEMSFIGPRPLLVSYLDRYTEEQNRRHEVLPGLTGYAQVNGRNAIGWAEKFKLDVSYVNNISFFLDSKILLLTIKKVILHEGITQAGHVTTTEFIPEEKISPNT